MSSVTHCLSPCLAESEGIGSQSVKERQQRKRMARISHNSLFQLVVALRFEAESRMMTVRMSLERCLGLIDGLMSTQEMTLLNCM